jgi:hypothetical protein
MSGVTEILEYKNRNTVEALTDMLHRAHQGRMRGLVFIYKSGPKRHRVGITGEYWEDPAQALGAAVRLSYRLNQAITALEAKLPADAAEPPPGA